MKYYTVLLSIFVSLFIASANALIPPKYLSVPKWQNCVSTVQKGSASFVCLPNAKPLKCPESSWKTLKNQHLVDLCKQ